MWGKIMIKKQRVDKDTVVGTNLPTEFKKMIDLPDEPICWIC